MSRILNSRQTNNSNAYVGSKARGLLRLKNNGFLCPEFYVLDFDLLNKISSGTCNLNEELQEWKTTNKIAANKLWAVRSSTEEEDGGANSFAGLFLTELNVKTDQLAKAINNVLESYTKSHYDKSLNNIRKNYGIIIQEMINPDYSGVMFSNNPENVRDNTIFINVIPGLGENLVSGKEEAFVIKSKSGKLVFEEIENTYQGNIYQDKLLNISKSGHEIQNELEGKWRTLIKGTKKLSKITGYGVDIEFCISDNKIFWLQVRPITTGKKESFYWDNTASEGNYPGLILPLSIDLIKTSFSKAYKGLAKYLGMSEFLLCRNESLLNNMTGEIKGGLYYNITAWQKLINQLPFGKRISNSLPLVWGMEHSEFYPEKFRFAFFNKTKMFIHLIFSILFLGSIKKRYIKRYNNIYNKIDSIDLKSKSYPELIEIYKTLEYEMIDNWDAPLLNNLFTVIMMMISKKLIAKSKLNKIYPNFINDSLFAQSKVISVKIVNEFKAILKEIKNNAEFYHIFKNNKADVIFEEIKKREGKIYNRIFDYIQNYGDRSDQAELKMESVTYKENPIRFIKYIKENLKFDLDQNYNQISFDYKLIVRKQYKFNWPYRILILWIVNKTINRVADRENFRFMRTRTYGIVRRIFREIDSKLLSDNFIHNRNDSLYLNLDELLNSDLRINFNNIVKLRKKKYLEYSNIDRSTRYVQRGDEFSKVELNFDNISNSVIKGIGCCSGIVQAKVKIFDSDKEFINDTSKNIFVANYFEPGELGLFSQAAGLISVRGNLLGHTAILCREMGIPSIVGAKTILNHVKDGDIIEMDGSTGLIEIIKNGK